MRLTNVTHLRLPFGRLWGYDVSASALGRRLPVSFDQRLHVGAGDRPGSWMALSFSLPARTSRESIADAWLSVIARHGTLQSAFARGVDGEPVLHEIEIGPGDWVEHHVGPGQAVNDALRDVLDAACSPYQHPSHRLCVLETAAGFTVVIAADHAHVDMWSMLVIARDLLRALDAGRANANLRPAPERTPEPVRAFVEHTQALLERDAAPEPVRQRWEEIIKDSGGVMPQFPLSLGAPRPHRERVELRDVFAPDDAAAFAAQARNDGVSTLARAVVAMTAVTREVADRPLRAVFPVHSRFDDNWHDSVGWFITNSVLESNVAAPHAAAAAVKEAVQLGAWPLADVLAPWGGMPVAPGMFAISWLDLRRLPVRIDSIGLDAQYVSAATDTDGVMLWFILDEMGLHLRCRYPDTAEARANVGGWLDLLVARLQADARSSIRGQLHVGGQTFRLERAGRDDVEAITALLRDGRSVSEREREDLDRAEAAFTAVTRDSFNYLAIVRDDTGRIVATMQLTVTPGLSRGGSTRLLIDALRVASEARLQGLIEAMIEWAHDFGRGRGARLAHVVSDDLPDRTSAFYARLGYQPAQIGMERNI